MAVYKSKAKGSAPRDKAMATDITTEVSAATEQLDTLGYVDITDLSTEALMALLGTYATEDDEEDE